MLPVQREIVVLNMASDEHQWKTLVNRLPGLGLDPGVGLGYVVTYLLAQKVTKHPCRFPW